MTAKLYLDILPQPDNITCGPTCLHAIYRYFGDEIPLHQVVSEVPQIATGGTLAVSLAVHALRRGYNATIYSYNLQIFDPTWASARSEEIAEKLKIQASFKKADPSLEVATKGYLEFLELGGELRFEVLTAGLIRRYLKRSLPVLSGLSATYLYNSAREYSDGNDLIFDDIRGKSMGHFVVLAGYDKQDRTVLIADPFLANPVTSGQYYRVNILRLVCAIMLGTLTFDGDLLIIKPAARRKGRML
ncbi:MAG: C39 family peptidase [Deltaproteobacteria bacterium]|nr:C39 family peptidase [Deltaproteobacteria bacterium]